ncbi:16723_t:CDS:2, partial [Cetraspora pellucida]
LFPNNFNNLPNLHINRHHVQNVHNFGMLVNISVGVKEAMHKTFKGLVAKTNCKNIEFDFIRQHNKLQMICYLIDEGKDSCFNIQEEDTADISKYIYINFQLPKFKISSNLQNCSVNM